MSILWYDFRKDKGDTKRNLNQLKKTAYIKDEVGNSINGLDFFLVFKQNVPLRIFEIVLLLKNAIILFQEP